MSASAATGERDHVVRFPDTAGGGYLYVYDDYNAKDDPRFAKRFTRDEAIDVAQHWRVMWGWDAQPAHLTKTKIGGGR